jgi:hypothetical protein
MLAFFVLVGVAVAHYIEPSSNMRMRGRMERPIEKHGDHGDCEDAMQVINACYHYRILHRLSSHDPIVLDDLQMAAQMLGVPEADFSELTEGSFTFFHPVCQLLNQFEFW